MTGVHRQLQRAARAAGEGVNAFGPEKMVGTHLRARQSGYKVNHLVDRV